jgi:hypothetical protein
MRFGMKSYILLRRSVSVRSGNEAVYAENNNITIFVMTLLTWSRKDTSLESRDTTISTVQEI